MGEFIRDHGRERVQDLQTIARVADRYRNGIRVFRRSDIPLAFANITVFGERVHFRRSFQMVSAVRTREGILQWIDRELTGERECSGYLRTGDKRTSRRVAVISG